MLEVLMVTMNRGFEVLEKSKICSNAVLANQSKYTDESVKTNQSVSWRKITTNTVGVGNNRNIALLYATGPYCILMDDDMECLPNYEKIIISYFKKLPDADLLILNVETIGMDMGRKTNSKIQRVHYWNFMNYGAVRIAFKLDSIKRENIHFNTLFGGGCIYSSGEDTLFLKECLDAGLIIYTVPYCYAKVNQTTSSWFHGIDKKYIYDKGALMKAMFKHLYLPLDLLFSWKLKNKSDYSFFDCIKLMINGSKNYAKLVTFDAYKAQIQK